MNKIIAILMLFPTSAFATQNFCNDTLTYNVSSHDEGYSIDRISSSVLCKPYEHAHDDKMICGGEYFLYFMEHEDGLTILNEDLEFIANFTICD